MQNIFENILLFVAGFGIGTIVGKPVFDWLLSLLKKDE